MGCASHPKLYPPHPTPPCRTAARSTKPQPDQPVYPFTLLSLQSAPLLPKGTSWTDNGAPGPGAGGGGGGAAPPKRSLCGWVGQGWVECDQQSPRQLPACVPCHSVQASTCRRWACHVRGGQWVVGDRVVCLAVHHAPPPAPPGGMPTTWLDQPSRHRRVDECPSLPPPDGLPFMPCPSHTPPPGFCCFCCCSLDDDKHDLLEGHLRHFAARQVSGRVGAGVGGG